MKQLTLMIITLSLSVELLTSSAAVRAQNAASFSTVQDSSYQDQSPSTRKAPEGARVPGQRTKQGPDAGWVPYAALGLMVFFFLALFGLRALRTRRGKPPTTNPSRPKDE